MSQFVCDDYRHAFFILQRHCLLVVDEILLTEFLKFKQPLAPLQYLNNLADYDEDRFIVIPPRRDRCRVADTGAFTGIFYFTQRRLVFRSFEMHQITLNPKYNRLPSARQLHLASPPLS